MPSTRRKFIEAASSFPALASAAQAVLSLPVHAATEGYQSNLLPSQKAVWEWQLWMAKLGPKYTGNRAHRTFVEFLAKYLGDAGLDVSRDHYSFPRWEARRWEIMVTPQTGSVFAPPVTSYFPYSGATSSSGVTGDLIYAGTGPDFEISDKLKGKIAVIDCPTSERPYGEWYKVWGVYPSDVKFPSSVRPARSSVNQLTDFQKAGALGVILSWTDISDANAADQYTPFSRPIQNIPALWVGRETGATLRILARDGARATLTLEAEVTPDSPTDTLIATLPGASPDEAIIVNTHTDGPNAIEENGGLGILALAKYFAQIPKDQRRRTLVFALTTGHFAGPWVPSIRGVIDKHPELIKKTVAAVTIEHLGCREWADDASLHYKATGENELSVALSPHQSTAKVLLDCLEDSANRRNAVVNPVKGGFLGEGSALARAGVPTIGYMPMPNYLLAGPQDGCIEKVSPELLHSQIEVFAKVIHTFDKMTAAQLRA
jgi:hypothetical protein